MGVTEIFLTESSTTRLPPFGRLDDNCVNWYIVSLFYLLAETQPEHQPCTGEAEREGEPDASQAPVENETEKVWAEQAKAQSVEYGHSLEREICFLAVHSVLHLLGYDHETSEEDERYMKQKQEDVLIKIGFPRK